MTLLNFNLFLICFTAAAQVYSEELRRSGLESKDINNPKLPPTTPTLRLLRIKDTTLKKEVPIMDEYLGFTYVALDYLIFDPLPKWYNPLEPVIAPLDDPERLFDSDWYSSDVPSILILHDKCSNWDAEEITAILKALTLRKFPLNYNIFVMDFPNFKCSMLLSFTESFNKILGYDNDLEIATKSIVKFFKSGIETDKILPDQINLIGIGLSVQLAGEVVISMDTKIKSIVGLEPDKSTPIPFVKPEHVELFQVYYTSKLQDVHYQTDTRVDIHAMVIPGSFSCDDETTVKCLEKMGIVMIAGVILMPRQFKAWPCDNPEEFKKENEDCSLNPIAITYPPTDTPAGLYYLRIKTTFPFGVGEDGRKFDYKTVDRNNIDKGKGIVFDPTFMSFGEPDDMLKSDYFSKI